MNGDKGKQLLKNYLVQTDEVFARMFMAWVEEAGRVGRLPADLLPIFGELATKGKKIRGALVELGYRLAGQEPDKKILQVGLALELFHAAVLIQDDIMDEDEKRRGVTALHRQYADYGMQMGINNPKLFGESMAVCVSDWGFYASWRLLLTSGFPAAELVEAGNIYAEYVMRLAHGQALDVANSGLKEKSEEDVLNVLKYKTAEYTGVMPLLVGTVLGGMKDKAKVEALKKYGLAFGWAFQIQDDILGLYGAEELGKPIGSDLREGKNTLLMMHLAKNGTESQKDFQRKVMGNKRITEEDVEKMREILKESGTYQYVVDLGWNYVKKGTEIVPEITDDSELQKVMVSLITYMMERTL